MVRWSLLLVAGLMACDAAENHKDTSANYGAGSLPDGNRTADVNNTQANSPATSESCARAQECFRQLSESLCDGKADCREQFAMPAGHSGQTTCANYVREAREKVEKYTAGKDFTLPAPCMP